MAKNKQQLSKQYIESLKPSPNMERVNYYDTKVNGLELSVTPTGIKTFSVLKWINGKTQRVGLGRYDGAAVQSPEFDRDPLCVLGNNPRLTIEQARILALATISELSSGRTPRELHRQNADEMTLGQLFEEYMEKYAKDHCKSWKVMEECFERYLGDWKNRLVGSIKRTDVQMLVNKLAKERGKTTANRSLELLRAIINKGKQWLLVSGDNPATGITRFKMKPRDRFLYEHEIPKLAAAIEAEKNEDIRDYVLISLYTGARKSNVLSMRWEHIDLDAGTWLIPDTKNNTAQTILLTDAELDILRRRHQSRKSKLNFEYVFPGTGVDGHLADPKKGWKRILKNAGIKDLHLHDLRRTLGSYMAMTGASLSVIGNALNHKDVSTTRKVYAHSAREAERTAREVAHQKMFAKHASERIVDITKAKTS
jgi:integrase